MFLKSIEVRGFKSFADKTEIEFKEGVTSVVGPNGSGKSNISDAIRWVLGEKSAKSLRGDKMQDVIFAGTQYRKPVGLAQVALTLDNSDGGINIDYSQVKVMRRLYRSGDSEYFINNTKCRLKDVQELFLDTGIGKEGYSIIGQGKIDAVLSAQPEERRMLLEEAAGIVKYKNRKIEAEKKLSNVEQNLVRIEDIIGTYEERIEPLRIEKEKAEKFLGLSNKLELAQINVIIDSVEKNEARLKELDNKVSAKSKELETHTRREEELKEQVKTCEDEYERFEENNSKQRQDYYALKEKHQSNISNISILQERIKNVDDFIQRSLNTINELEEKAQNFKEKDSKTITQKTEIEEKLQATKELIQKHQTQLSGVNKVIDELKTQLANVKEEINTLTLKSNQLNNNKLIFEKDASRIEEELENQSHLAEASKRTLQVNHKTQVALNFESSKVKRKIEELNEKKRESSEQLQKSRREHTRQENELKMLSSEHMKIQTNYNLLVNFEKEYEGYNKSIKNLMKDVERGKVGVASSECAVLGEVITVNKDYEVAVETAVGGAISNVITTDERTAKRLINHLKSNKLGRVTFLPQNIIKGKKLEPRSDVKSHEGFVGIASDLVEFKKSYENVINHVLGRTLVVDTIDNALDIAKKTNYTMRIVTLGGELLNLGGALTGGTIYKRHNIIGRKREIDELKSRADEVLNSINKKTNELEILKSKIGDIDEGILNITDSIHSENVESAKLQARLTSMEEEAVKVEKSIEKYETNIKSLEERVLSKFQKIEKVEKEGAELQQKLQTNQQLLKETEDKISNTISSNDTSREELTELKVKEAQQIGLLSNIKSEHERNLKEIEDNIKLKENALEQIKESKTDRENFVYEITENEQKVEKIKKVISRLEEKFSEYEVERVKLKEKIEKVNSQKEMVDLELAKHKSELQKYEVDHAKWKVEKETQLAKLNDDMNLTYAEALEYRMDEINASELKRQIDELKRKISALGTVNVAAIEEYRDLKEKFRFMSGQRDDLLDSKEELEGVINEMSDKMRVVFKENFVVLKQLFNETFKELFKGGSADLILRDGDELTSKIDINVQPPGKKLQSINLLSGGEKVLSAIALMFSILKMKPTPFCILDEIEAALDEANVYKYAEFLKRFSEKTQFIVITHRKGTMQVSNALYGVTMEEKGVSKVISVDVDK